MLRRKIILSVLVLGFLSMAYSQFETEVVGTGTTSASFLEIGVGARAISMGGAYTSIPSGPSSIYYNPANIVWLDNIQVEFMHNQWLVNTSHDFLGAVIPLPFYNTSLGLSFINLDYGEQEVRTVSRPEGTGEMFGARDYAASVTLAGALTDRFSFGLSGKYINQSIWNTSSNGMAVDLGVFYKTQIDGLNMGMSICNFGGELQMAGRNLDTTVDPDPDHVTIDRVPAALETDSYPLPILFRAGISYNLETENFGSFITTMDVYHPSNATESISLGFEYGLLQTLFLRAGYNNLFQDDAENGLTFGAGLAKWGLRIDYAYSDWGILQSSSRISIGMAL